MGKALFRWPESPAAGWCAEWRVSEPFAAVAEPATAVEQKVS